MDAYSGDYSDLSYSDTSPILIAASSASAMQRAEGTVLASGYRIGGRVPIEEATSRLTMQASAKAVWVELDRDGGIRMDELLNELTDGVSRGSYAAIVSATPALVDPVSARVDDDWIELLVGADEAERTAALALAIARHERPRAFAEMSADRSAESLRQLSEQVNRIASTLARIAADPPTAKPTPQSPTTTELPPLSVETIRNIIRARRLRARFFPEELFADPAWDMFLDLLQAEIVQLRVPVSSLCIAAAVPATTALRWLKTLVSQGLFVRRPDPHDGRRVYVELAPETSTKLRRYFAEVGAVGLI